MRGQAQRPGPAGRDDFWTWRNAMYELADSLTPEALYQISRIAYEDLRRSGIRTVGEFHYVHHDKGGTPYDHRTCMSEAVIQAARDEGLRICLLRVVYARSGPDQEPRGAQQRFSDLSLSAALSDVDDLRSKYAKQDDVRIGIAPHSVRAVPPDWLPRIAGFAKQHQLPVHMHVAEQPEEIETCLAETGKRPVELLAERGVLSERFVAVHATHLASHEAKLLGDAGATVCLCPTTERDLGDGLPDVGALLEQEVRICVGVDSHVVTAPLEDLRGIELGERLRTGRRVTFACADETPAERLWKMGSQWGAEACGFDDPGGIVRISRSAHELALVKDEALLDAIVFGCTDAVWRTSEAP